MRQTENPTQVYSGWLQLWRGAGDHEFVSKEDVVAFLVFNYDRQAVALVSQARPAVGWRLGPEEAVLFEVPAGHVESADINNPCAAMAREAAEELGADFDLDGHNFELISPKPLFVSPGFTTERVWLGYAKAGDQRFDISRRVFGVAAEGESVTRHWFAIDQLSDYLCVGVQDLKTFVLIQWFLLVKYPQIKQAIKEC